MTRGMGVLVAAAAFLHLATSGSQAETYRIRQLPIPTGYRSSIADALNDSGTVVGGLWDDSGDLHTAVWKPDGSVLIDPVKPEGTLGREAMGVNNLGQIALSVSDADYMSHGILLNPDGSYLDIGSLGGGYTVPWAVNDLGQVVGRSRTASREDCAFIWSAATGIVDLGVPAWSYACDINNDGVVIGDSTATGDFRWTRSGCTYFGWPNSVSAINNLGQAVGHSSVVYGDWLATVWNPDGTKRVLGPGHASGINDLGQVVGSNEGVPMLWEPDGRTVALDVPSNYPGCEAVDINASGTIIGNNCPDGWYQAFVWEVVPEPSSVVSVGSGLLMACAFARRHNRRRSSACL